jgi:hypothetical protein
LTEDPIAAAPLPLADYMRFLLYSPAITTKKRLVIWGGRIPEG